MRDAAAIPSSAVRPSTRDQTPLWVSAICIGALLLLALAPLYTSAYTLTMLLPVFAYAIALLGFNLLFGYAGLLSFGHAMFLGIGAYTAAVLTGPFGVKSMELILLAAMAAAGIAALGIGALCVRYTRIFFGMLTLSFGMLFHSFLIKFYHLTGGDTGMTVKRVHLAGIDLSDMPRVAFQTGPYYYYALVLLVLSALLMWRIVRSPLGLALRAQRDNARKAEYLGVRIHRFRLVAFVVSAAYAAVAGVLLAVRAGNADPELAYWTHSGELVFMTVLGGFASFLGPVIGAFSFIFLRDWLMTLTEFWRLAMGVVLVLTVIFFPRGLAGLVQDAATRLRGGAR